MFFYRTPKQKAKAPDILLVALEMAIIAEKSTKEAA
jgi:hypothetical protein